ncbi:MAG: DUF4494 domain-containing protein [Bacteroidaceae bacterium]|jgi:hypothetical protein|nr:DUF4494 domain-containing protein [Bacteroidaceae bacterium]
MIINGWFECKVKLEKQVEGSDMPKKVPEVYLVDALNFTEAEARIIEEVSPYCSGEVEVMDIKKARYAEMFPCELDSADKWFKVKCMFVTLDEKTQQEKKSSQNILVQAGDLREAIRYFDEGMKGSMVDYEIAAVNETNILDVFPYTTKPGKDDKPEFEQG